MKIKAKRPFVSGRFTAKAGETVDVPAKRAAKLISIGVASEVKTKKKDSGSEATDEGQDGPEDSPTDAGGEIPTPEKRPAQAAQEPTDANTKAGGKNGNAKED